MDIDVVIVVVHRVGRTKDGEIGMIMDNEVDRSVDNGERDDIIVA